MSARRKTPQELRQAEWQFTALMSTLLFLLVVVVTLIVPPLGVLVAGGGVWLIVRSHRRTMSQIVPRKSTYRQFGGR